MFKMDFKELEKKMNLKIPSELAILNFIDLGQHTEVVGENSDFNINGYKYKVNENEWHEDIIIDHFIPLKDLEIFWSARTRLWGKKFKKKYVAIANVIQPYGAFIVISLNKVDFGTIWLEVGDEDQIQVPFEIKEEDYDDYFRFLLQNNFTSFLSTLERITFEDRIRDDLTFSMLYKNWGEDFWRVREEKIKDETRA